MIQDPRGLTGTRACALGVVTHFCVSLLDVKGDNSGFLVHRTDPTWQGLESSVFATNVWTLLCCGGTGLVIWEECRY